MEKILGRHLLAQTKKFIIESVDIDFDNGNQGQFELISFPGDGKGVMIVPIVIDNGSYAVVMIEHFMVSSGQSGYVLPGGYREPELSLEQIINKELQEEIGMKAEHIVPLIAIDTMPAYIRGTTQLCLAYDLSLDPLPGDEIETLMVHTLSYDNVMAMISAGQIVDSRSISALLFVWKNYIIPDFLGVG